MKLNKNSLHSTTRPIKAEFTSLKPQGSTTVGLRNYLAITGHGNNEIFQKRQKLARKIWGLRKLQKQKALENAHKKLANIIIQAEHTYRETVKNAEKDCLDIAMAALKNLLGKEARADLVDSLAIKITSKLSTLERERSVKVQVNPVDFENLKIKLQPTNQQVLLVPQPEIPSGTANLILHSGTIEINWIKKMDQILKELQGAL